MSNIIEFSGITTLPIDPDKILEKAMGKLDNVLVIGMTKDGEEYFAASDSDGGNAVWMMERAKHTLMKIADQED